MPRPNGEAKEHADFDREGVEGTNGEVVNVILNETSPYAKASPSVS